MLTSDHQQRASGKSYSSFVLFFLQVKESGGIVTSEEILKMSKLFRDEITLDSLSKPQLAALCRVLEIQPIGTSNVLRFQLRMKLRSLAADDIVSVSYRFFEIRFFLNDDRSKPMILP